MSTARPMGLYRRLDNYDQRWRLDPRLARQKPSDPASQEAGGIMNKLAGAAALTLGLVLGAGVTAWGAPARQAAPSGSMWCVTFGKAGGTSAAGNWVLYNWSRAQCPAGTYPVSNPQQAPSLTDGQTFPFYQVVHGVTQVYTCTVGMITPASDGSFEPTVVCK